MILTALLLMAPQSATALPPRQQRDFVPGLPDCNGNGLPDSAEIRSGQAQDCQGDGIPDECQLAEPFVYSYDDGGMDGSVGTDPRHVAWMTNHTVLAGQETITDIELGWGTMATGTPATLTLWSDPDGDGDPTDAQVLMSHVAFAVFPNTGIVVLEDIPDTYVGPAGTSFFVGAYGEFEPFPTNYPAGLDDDSLIRQSWWVTSNTPIDPNDLSSGDIFEFGLIGDFCPCDGDWMIRALACGTGHCGESEDTNGNAIPDECDPDCNGNSVPDDLDLANGTSTDCDMDLVPDECVLPDCDGNGHADLCQAQEPQGLAGEYYPNKFLLGTPIPRMDPMVFFDFDVDPPFPGSFPTDNFSVRWTGSVISGDAGTYIFELNHDDGVRLWVNGVLIIDIWDDGAATHSGSIDLDAATEYYIKLEYNEGSGEAFVELSWQPPGGTMTPIPSASLRPNHDRDDDGIPDLCQITDCNANGVADDEDIAGGTVTDCDADLVPDECQPCEDADANGLLDSCELAAGNGLTAQYWTSNSAGEFTDRFATQVDPNIDYDWGTGAPLSGMPNDDFAVRWTGTLTTPAVTGLYRFHVRSDDGVRFWLDGALLVDEWHPSSGNIYEGDVALDASTAHLLELDYYEAGGDALVYLHWTVPGQSEVPVPSSALTADTDLDGDTIPDLSDADCDLNGVPDAVDIVTGTHPDTDGNCVPDVCDGGAGYWRFEEPGGGTASDSTANENDGTLGSPAVRVGNVPVATIPLTGAANTQSLNLDYDSGSGGSVSVPDASGLLSAGDGSFTLEGWVRLDQVSDTSDPNQRQWLFQKKPSSSSDDLLDYALLVQAGNLGGNGRELMLRYGDGSAQYGVRSLFTIDDTDWHFVSVAYDARNKRLRFGLDGLFEERPFEKPDMSSSDPLILGAHENSAGALNQFTRGRVDELRMTRAYLTPDQLLDAE